MGDYRFTFKATFEMGAVTDKCDMWMNYSPGDFTSIDRRVEEWLDGLFQRGKASIDEAIYAADHSARDAERVERENAILAEADEIRARRANPTPSEDDGA